MKKRLLAFLMIISLIFAVTPAVFAADTVTAKPISSTVLVNGENVAFDAYNINGNNYFKLRDLAYILSGTAKQFDVGWDNNNNAISLSRGKAYTAAGGEMTGKGAGDKTAAPTNSKIYLDGNEVQFTAYNIEGNNYFKLRDIGAAFDFGVDWDGAKNTIAINTANSYTPEASAASNTPAASPAATEGETNIKDAIDNLPHPMSVKALWDSLEGYWNSMSGDGLCVSFNYEQGAAILGLLKWESSGLPGGSMIEVKAAGEYLVNYSIHYEAVEEDNMSDARPAMTVVYQVDFSYLANNELAIAVRNLTDNEDWIEFYYAGATYDEAYESYLFLLGKNQPI